MSRTEALSSLWRSIPGHWKRAFAVALAVNFFVFFYGMAQYPLGDHDVGYLKGVSPLSGGATGRWFLPFLYALNGYLQVPVWQQTLAFFFQIGAGMGAVLLWRRDASFVLLLSGALLVSLLPFVTEQYYYHWQAHSFPFAQLCMILALAVAAKRSLLRLILASGLTVAGLATYQPCALTFAVVWCGLAAMAIVQWDGTAKEARKKALDLAFPLLALTLGTLIYAGSLAFFSLFGLIKLGNYQFQPVAGSPLLRVVEVIFAAFAHLWLSQPYSPRLLKALLLFLTVAGGVCLLGETCRAHTRAAFTRVILLAPVLAGLVVSSKSLFLFSGFGQMYMYRFAGPGLSYVYLFFLCALLGSASATGRKLGVILICVILPICAVNDLRAQEHLVHSNRHDLAVLNRVVARIEALEAFEPGREYAVVQFGRTKPYIPTIYPRESYDVEEVYFFRNTISQAWQPGFELELLSAYLKFGIRLWEQSTEHLDLLARAAQLAKDRQPFPHKDSCFITEDGMLVLVFNAQAVEYALGRADLNPAPEK